MDISRIRMNNTNVPNFGKMITAHAQSVVLVSRHYFSKALIQFPRNAEVHAITHFAPYFPFFPVQSVLYRESS